MLSETSICGSSVSNKSALLHRKNSKSKDADAEAAFEEFLTEIDSLTISTKDEDHRSQDHKQDYQEKPVQSTSISTQKQIQKRDTQETKKTLSQANPSYRTKQQLKQDLEEHVESGQQKWLDFNSTNPKEPPQKKQDRAPVSFSLSKKKTKKKKKQPAGVNSSDTAKPPSGAMVSTKPSWVVVVDTCSLLENDDRGRIPRGDNNCLSPTSSTSLHYRHSSIDPLDNFQSLLSMAYDASYQLD
eukprot:CAMPEP_0195534630 /NCGR_PEP_ID=MMETSP0794_2-20130614/42756_1 /TAXON_ID=515487 /ORGANISM="Stephanopyxis turris, Strain CCMP 815" /LENGTH=241 /DNA_ID=CAMNT_0040667529 /DNA_START=177 /DNA_END=899 /DNA_ORIENTATION=+